MTDAHVDDSSNKKQREEKKVKKEQKVAEVSELAAERDNPEKDEKRKEIKGAEEKDLKDPLLETEQEREKFKEKYYYIAAELENIRRRHERETQNLVKYGNERILSSLLTVVDNLDLTLLAVANEDDEKIKNIVMGIQMVKDQFIETLKQNGLEVIETNEKEFDPKLHEAIGQKEVEGMTSGVVIEEVQKGYMLNGRVLRASKVITSK